MRLTLRERLSYWQALEEFKKLLTEKYYIDGHTAHFLALRRVKQSEEDYEEGFFI